MTIEDKHLLLKDLCARLPYDVKCQIDYDNEEDADLGIKRYCDDRIISVCVETEEIGLYETSEYFYPPEIKPYLRSISSMTQGEWEEMTALIYPYGRVNRNPDNKNELLLWLSAEGNEIPIMLINDVFSWLNKHYFDYHGLIPMGLALEAPKDMYN